MRKNNTGLGRGLDAIFLENEPMGDLERKENTVRHLKLSLIDPRSEQPRKTFDREALESLANSIRTNGLFQPILVRESGVGRYQIIAGERRFRACKIAEMNEIPAIVLDKDDKKTAEIALIENVQRENLNPIEEAAAYQCLAVECDVAQDELS
ncbi:MAG: ParB/RepB/Spo0J family partition protein [Clostridia bacterium]|nr:ParB/RepB/Spo0J family partition protein [Clostridia bacterium]